MRENKIKLKIKYELGAILCIIFLLFFFFFLIRATGISQDRNSFCKLKFGDEFYTSGFGDRCDYINYETGIKEERYYRQEELDEYCPAPKFFDITKWEGECMCGNLYLISPIK